MIKALRNRLFRIRYPYQSELELRRANALNLIGFLLFLLSSGWAIISVVLTGVLSGGILPLLGTFGGPLVALLVGYLARNGYLRAATFVFIGLMFAGPLVVVPGGLSSNNVLFILLPLIAASGLLDRRGLLGVVALLLVLVALGAVAQSQQLGVITINRANRALLDGILMSFSVLVILLLLYTFTGQTQEVAERAQARISSTSRLTRFAASLDPSEIEDEAEIVDRALRFVMNELGYSFAQMFIADSEGALVQRVRVGLGTYTVAQSDDGFGMGDTSSIVLAARLSEAQVVGMEDAENRRRHFLPATRQGIAVPVITGRALLGVLDVQTERETIDDHELQVLDALAQLIATSIRQVRVNNALRDNLAKQEQINQLARSGSSISRAQLDAMQYWDTHLQKPGQSVIGFDAPTLSQIVAAQEITDDLRRAIAHGDVFVEEADDHRVINVPIMIGNDPLGVMRFELPPDAIVNERRLATARIIARRLAVALENRRLIEQSQAQVERERKAAQVVNDLISATDVQTVMRRAVDNFNRALGAINTAIHIEPSLLAQALGDADDATLPAGDTVEQEG